MLDISDTITAVPRPTTEATFEEWQRLAAAVTERMAELRMLIRDFDGQGVSRSVASQILNPDPDKTKFETRILRNLCVALGWRASSFERILQGEAPQLIPVAADRSPEAITVRKEDFDPATWDELRRLLGGRPATRPSPEPEPEGP